jgi:Phage tail assembly chaperone proteins, E, or 41 or 14
MSKTVTIKLMHPFPGHGGEVTEVVLRPPTARDYLELGEPVIYASTNKDMFVHAENDGAVKAYIERCIQRPDLLLALSQLSLEDTMAVKREVLRFFADARVALSLNAAPSS